MVKRICIICGTPFDVYPSDTKKTCSADCMHIYLSKIRTGKKHPWGEEAKQRLRDKPTPKQLSLGLAASMQRLDSQRGPLHRECKVWHLRAPNGEDFVAVGILPWARENAWRFGETDEEGARRIASGFRGLATSLRGKRKRPVGSYKGWELIGMPERKKIK